MVSRLATLTLFVALGACGASSSSSDGGPGGACTAFDCNTIASCSSLSVSQCNGLCSCYEDRWSAAAFDAFAGCLLQCQSIGDSYATCFVVASSMQPTFVDPQYIANCDAKRSVCPTYPTDACDPVTLGMLSDGTFSNLVHCLGEPCDGTAEACVETVLTCGVAAP